MNDETAYSATGMHWALPVMLLTGLMAASALLAAATYDFAVQFRWLAIGPATLFAAILSVAIRNTLAVARSGASVTLPKPSQRALLVFAIPAGFLASSLGCMGMELAGCTPTCNTLTRGAIPLTLVAAIAYMFAPRGRGWLLLLLTCVSLLFLIPNCRCDNVINHRWINLLGQSPACFSLGVTIAMTSVAALSTGRRVWFSAGLAWAAVGACFSFFIAHHMFHFPW